jgi:hypothetical protein
LGPLVAKALFKEDLEIKGNNILLISDNDFGSYIENTLRCLGGNVYKNTKNRYHIDAVVFAHTPKAAGGNLDLNKIDLPRSAPLCCQLWGDVDRSYFSTRWIPEIEPPKGQMGLLLSDLGFAPVVKLQAGGLKVGELLAKSRHNSKSLREFEKNLSDPGYAQLL